MPRTTAQPGEAGRPAPDPEFAALDRAARAAAVLRLCREQGFLLAGVCAAEPAARQREYREWIAAGKHGSMAWLERSVEDRLDPRRVLRGARSVVVVADRYARRADDPALPVAPAQGKVARYARGRDYHVVMKRRLHAVCDRLRVLAPADQFRAFVDTAPVHEREHAARAGLGWIGKHTLLINPREGSWLFLAGILTTLDLAPDAPGAPEPDHCGTCTRCIDACPTGAITPYSVDARRCISYLTIERRAPIGAAFHGPIADWLYGCDICQEVCPFNQPRRESGDSEFPAYAARFASLPLADVLAWSASDRAARLSASAMKRATLEMLRRNAAIAAGNALSRAHDPALAQALQRVAHGESEPPALRLAAEEALRRATKKGPPSPAGPVS